MEIHLHYARFLLQILFFISFNFIILKLLLQPKSDYPIVLQSKYFQFTPIYKKAYGTFHKPFC